MILVVAALAGIGLACTLYRRTLLGVLLGLQLLVLAATLIFSLAGAQDTQMTADGQAAGFLVSLYGLSLTVAGAALSVRLFYLKRKASLDDVRSLKH